VYVTNLYSSASNYVPALVASVFYDSVFEGKLLTASNKIERIQNRIMQTPQSFSDDFKNDLTLIRQMVYQEIERRTKEGHNPENLKSFAFPQKVRDALGFFILPDISVLYYAPAVTLP
jgi:hypothetical protein